MDVNISPPSILFEKVFIYKFRFSISNEYVANPQYAFRNEDSNRRRSFPDAFHNHALNIVLHNGNSVLPIISSQFHVQSQETTIKVYLPDTCKLYHIFLKNSTE